MNRLLDDSHETYKSYFLWKIQQKNQPVICCRGDQHFKGYPLLHWRQNLQMTNKQCFSLKIKLDILCKSPSWDASHELFSTIFLKFNTLFSLKISCCLLIFSPNCAMQNCGKQHLQIHILLLFFRENKTWFHVCCLPSRQFTCNVKLYFLWKMIINKIFQNVVCCCYRFHPYYTRTQTANIMLKSSITQKISNKKHKFPGIKAIMQ